MLQLGSAVASNPLKTLYSTDFAVNNMKPSMDFGGFGLRAQVNCLVKFQPWGCYVFEPLRLYEERAATKSKKDELQDPRSALSAEARAMIAPAVQHKVQIDLDQRFVCTPCLATVYTIFCSLLSDLDNVSCDATSDFAIRAYKQILPRVLLSML